MSMVREPRNGMEGKGEVRDEYEQLQLVLAPKRCFSWQKGGRGKVKDGYG